MNKYKLLFGTLLISGILSSGVIYADTKSKNYVGIELKAYNVYKQIAQISRSNNLGQSYYNAGNINSCTGNENGIVAKLNTITLTADELEITTGNTTKDFEGAYVSSANTYTLYLKNYTWSVCKSSHSGTWYHN